MLDSELQREVIKRALSNGGEYADLFVEHRKQTSLILEDGTLEKIIIGSDSGAGIRLVWNGKTSYAYSNDLTKEALMRAASEVSKAAAGRPSGSVIDLTVRRPAVTFEVTRCPADVPIEEKISIVSAANDASREFDSRIKQVTAIYRDSVQDVCIASAAFGH